MTQQDTPGVAADSPAKDKPMQCWSSTSGNLRQSSAASVGSDAAVSAAEPDGADQLREPSDRDATIRDIEQIEADRITSGAHDKADAAETEPRAECVETESLRGFVDRSNAEDAGLRQKPDASDLKLTSKQEQSHARPAALDVFQEDKEVDVASSQEDDHTNKTTSSGSDDTDYLECQPADARYDGRRWSLFDNVPPFVASTALRHSILENLRAKHPTPVPLESREFDNDLQPASADVLSQLHNGSRRPSKHRLQQLQQSDARLSRNCASVRSSDSGENARTMEMLTVRQRQQFDSAAAGTRLWSAQQVRRHGRNDLSFAKSDEEDAHSRVAKADSDNLHTNTFVRAEQLPQQPQQQAPNRQRLVEADHRRRRHQRQRISYTTDDNERRRATTDSTSTPFGRYQVEEAQEDSDEDGKYRSALVERLVRTGDWLPSGNGSYLLNRTDPSRFVILRPGIYEVEEWILPETRFAVASSPPTAPSAAITSAPSPSHLPVIFADDEVAPRPLVIPTLLQNIRQCLVEPSRFTRQERFNLFMQFVVSLLLIVMFLHLCYLIHVPYIDRASLQSDEQSRSVTVTDNSDSNVNSNNNNGQQTSGEESENDADGGWVLWLACVCYLMTKRSA
jgi:hypothetical protein